MSTTSIDETLVEGLRYSQAIAELDEILEKIENEEIDLDDLATKVERAAELIILCRQKIEATEMSVKKVFDAMETSGGPEPEGETDS